MKTPIARTHALRLIRPALCLAALYAGNVAALNLTITAEFRPDAANPMKRQFTNTTPKSGFCVTWSLCGPTDFSIALPLTPRFVNMTTGSRNGAYFRVPSSLRKVTVTHRDGVSTAEVQWRVNLISMRQDNAGAVNAYAKWTGWGSYPPSPCVYVAPGLGNSTWYESAWRIPLGAGGCEKRPAAAVPITLNMSRLSIGYLLTTPDPLALKNGVYSGTLALTVGPGGDFDFGDRATVSDSVVNVRFVLTVAHDLNVTTPVGGTSTRLQPLGGWSRWTEHGVEPAALQSDLPFAITGSAPFSVKLDCEFPLGEHCAIRSNMDGDLAAVSIAVSMPGIRADASGRDANHYMLRANTGKETFIPTAPVVQRPSRLHFNVDGEPMRRMLDQPGSRWQGRATLIFDTQID